MSAFPNFSNVDGYVVSELERRKSNTLLISKLNCWARIISAVDNGLVLVSNPDIALFNAAGQGESIYGSSRTSGTIGKDWNGGAVNAKNESQVGLPRPVITSFEVDEGAGNISRKATFTTTAYTKAQLEEVAKYFLEPGFTVFLEWGWNTKDGVQSLGNVNVEYIKRAMNATTLKDVRMNSNGQYECYLGFVTGGSISFNGTAWEVTTNLTGFTELPSYFNVTDTATGEADSGCKEKLQPETFTIDDKNDNIALKRFKTMFNDLPGTKRTNLLKDRLLKNENNLKVINFINFDADVRKKLGFASKANWFTRQFSRVGIDTGASTVDRVEIPNGVIVVDAERFIKFSLFIDILNNTGVEYIKLGDTETKVTINTTNTPISAFDRIFSVDESKLFIPNEKTPAFSIAEARDRGSIGVSDNSVDCSIITKDEPHIKFPSDSPIQDGKVNGISLYYMNDNSIIKINKPARQWGYLDDLYVNFEFVNSILDTAKLSMKDALYEILNGISSAVNGLWDFQIIESPNTETAFLELRVVDLNFVPELKQQSTGTMVDMELEFQLYGPDSIFIDASFDMDIGGAMMNQIIGKRLSANINSSNPDVGGKLFAKGFKDKFLTQIEVICPPEPAKTTATTNEPQQNRNIEDFMDRVGIYPKVDAEAGVFSGNKDFAKSVYFATYRDRVLFNQYKNGVSFKEIGGRFAPQNQRDSNIPGAFVFSDDGYDAAVSKKTPSILLPIKFTFTIHGISGIKRGDMFVVNGLPDEYGSKNGFFQVLSVKHTVDAMVWKTIVEGGFRQRRS
jgi:hypothetical protein